MARLPCAVVALLLVVAGAYVGYALCWQTPPPPPALDYADRVAAYCSAPVDAGDEGGEGLVAATVVVATPAILPQRCRARAKWAILQPGVWMGYGLVENRQQPADTCYRAPAMGLENARSSWLASSKILAKVDSAGQCGQPLKSAKCRPPGLKRRLMHGF